MPTDSEFDKAFDQVKEYVERLGDEIIGEQKDIEFAERNNNIQYNILLAIAPSHDCRYMIHARSDREFFAYRYDYDLIRNISDAIESGQGEEFFGEDEYRSNDPEDLAREVINRVSDQDLDRLKFQLRNRVSNPLTIAQIEETAEGGVDKLSIVRHIFPYEDDFSLSDLYNTSLAVNAIGQNGADYLANSFAIQMPDETKDGDTEYGLEFDPENLF